jgi:transcriptional regulator with XRE-family HTH domain
MSRKLDFKTELKRRIEEQFAYQIRFADAICVNHATVTQWLLGATYPNTKNLRKLCNVLSWDYTEARKLILEDKCQRVIERSVEEMDAMDSDSNLSFQQSLQISGLRPILQDLSQLPPNRQKEMFEGFHKMIRAMIGREPR